MNKQRILWIDWMKVIGMYLIITGHLFPVGYTYIYVFNVPLFFLISGFLYKQEQSYPIFWKKILLNYITPVIIIRSIMYYWEKYISTDPSHFISIFNYWLFLLKGYQNCIGACWFIYTLIIIKILFQYLPYHKAIIGFFILFTCIAIYLNENDIHKNNAIINTTVAYQPFAIGYYLRRYNSILNTFRPSLTSTLIIVLLSLSLIVLCGETNGDVWLYKNGYGHSFLLYLVGTICGSMFIYILSKQLDSYFTSVIYTLSFGNILTLGFHQFFVNISKMHVNCDSIFSYILGVVILIAFYPIIIICKSYFPIVLGSYHPANNSSHVTKK